MTIKGDWGLASVAFYVRRDKGRSPLPHPGFLNSRLISWSRQASLPGVGVR